MKSVQKSVLIWYSAQEMYDLVTDVPAYPSFLPWCSGAEVLETLPDGVIARVGIGYAGLKQSFTTHNIQDPGRSLTMKLVDGPFSQLGGRWVFVPLPAPAAGGEPPRACRIQFELRYAFSSRTLELLIGPVFDRIANTLVDSFIKRADALYGDRAR